MKPTDDGGRIERRIILKGLAAGLAGAVATTDTVSARGPEPTVTAPAQPASAPPESARLLDEHQRRTLTSLAELLVPGAVAAGVVDLIDRVAAVDAPPRQRRLLNALGRFELEARTAHGARWIDLDEAACLGILRQASQGPESQPPQPAWIKGEPLVFAPTGPAPPATLRDHFDYLRTTVAGAYYSTDPGMKELGWTGRTAWTELSACTHPDPEHE